MQREQNKETSNEIYKNFLSKASWNNCRLGCDLGRKT